MLCVGIERVLKEAASHSCSPGGACAELANLVVPCPLDASVQLTGIVPAECSVFKSALSPMRLAFRTSHGASTGPGSMLYHGLLQAACVQSKQGCP